MVSENPTTPVFLSGTDPDPLENPPGRVDLVRFAVHAALAIYLLPVLLLVASIGLASIGVDRVARLVRKALSLRESGSGHSTPRPPAQVIGARPIIQTPRKRSRVIR